MRRAAEVEGNHGEARARPRREPTTLSSATHPPLEERRARSNAGGSINPIGGVDLGGALARERRHASPMSRLQSVLVPALSALVGGAVGALITVTLTAPPKAAKARATGEASAEVAAETQGSDDDRVAALERAVERLNRRTALQSLAGSAAAQNPGAPGAPIDAAPIVDNPVFEAAVRDVMERIDQERQNEREGERSEWRKQMVDQWSGDLAGKLRLSDAQVAKVKEVALGFMEKLRDLRNSDAGPPASREEWRTRVSALREQAEGDLAKTLDATQMTTYRELPDDERIGFGFGRRGGGGGRDRARSAN